MPEILFNAFSFLQNKLAKNGFEYVNVKMTVPENHTPLDLVSTLKLDDHDVEAVFINGKAGAFETMILEGDRIALIPPGTPGPHRLLFGIRRKKM